LPDLIHRGVARAVSVSLGFRVASKRSGDYGSKHIAGSAGSLDVLIEAADLEAYYRCDDRGERDAACEKQPVGSFEPKE
jgi:hypothetical protein